MNDGSLKTEKLDNIDKKRKYVVLCDDVVLSEFSDLDKAIDFASSYVFHELCVKIYQELIGNDESDFIRAFDGGRKWLYIKEKK